MYSAFQILCLFTFILAIHCYMKRFLECPCVARNVGCACAFKTDIMSLSDILISMERLGFFSNRMHLQFLLR